MTAAAARANVPPPLPNTRPCVAADVEGTWRWALFEQPESPRFAQFQANRFHYAYFDKDQIAVELDSKTPYTDPNVLQDAMREQYKTQMEQFILTKDGVIYLYAHRKPIGGYYCQIVTENKPGYRVGHMLWRTSEQNGKVQIVRHFVKAVFGPPPGQTPPKPAQPAPPPNSK